MCMERFKILMCLKSGVIDCHFAELLFSNFDKRIVFLIIKT